MSHGCFNRCWPKVSCPFKRICSVWLKGQRVYESGALEPAVCECELAARKWGSNHTGYSPIRLLSYAQSVAELFSISFYLSSSCHRFSFSILGVQTRLILGTFGDFWDSDTSQWSISVWEHSALYCDFQVLLAADPAVTTVHPCCVCLFCAHRMCWRMMRTLAMPIAPSLMKVGARPGWMRKEFFYVR